MSIIIDNGFSLSKDELDRLRSDAEVDAVSDIITVYFPGFFLSEAGRNETLIYINELGLNFVINAINLTLLHYKTAYIAVNSFGDICELCIKIQNGIGEEKKEGGDL